MVNNSAILILSGPSGAGKSTIINAASEEIGDYYFSISSTSRSPRDGEVDGREYYFVSEEEFELGIQNGDFLEYARVHDNYYGTSLKPVKKALEEGKLVIFDIDVQGFKLAKEKMGSLITSAFVLPPSLSVLEKRLIDRSTDSMDIIDKRIKNAKSEIEQIGDYDYVVINDDIELATKEFVSIARAARSKMSQEQAKIFIDEWMKS